MIGVAHLRAERLGNTASQRWRAVGDTGSDLTGPEINPHAPYK